MKIAICDDELSSIQEIRSLLTHWAVRHDLSFTLYQYSNGDDLLLALKHTSMDLIILDIIMPLLNGLDTARELRSEGITVPLIFLTSSRDFALGYHTEKEEDHPDHLVSLENITNALVIHFFIVLSVLLWRYWEAGASPMF